MSSVKACSLERGWYARLANEEGKEKLTLRNPDRGQRIELTDKSVKLLRGIFTEITKAGG